MANSKKSVLNNLIRGSYWDSLDNITDKVDEVSLFDKVASTFQTANRIISNKELSVSIINESDEHIARNNGEQIIYNGAVIEDLDNNNIVSLNGINYHELAHILFSPRANSDIGKFAKINKFIRSFNMLEEARIERLMCAKYPSVASSLEATILEYGLKDSQDNWGEMYPVLVGRKYIDLEVRQMVADMFVNTYGLDTATKISKLVNSYARLSFPKDSTVAQLIIRKFAELVGNDDEDSPFKVPKGIDLHAKRTLLTKGTPKNGKFQQQLQEGIKDEYLTEELRDTKDTIPDIGVGNELDESLVDVKDESYDDKHRLLTNLINNRLDTIVNSKNVQDDIKNMRSAINGATSAGSTLGKAKFLHEVEIETEAKVFARKFGKTLERMIRDSDPKWEADMPYGRLDVGKTMTPDINSINRVFERWDSGSPNTDIEAVILLDNSGSVGGIMSEICEKAWIIKRGIEYINGSVSVFNFNSYGEVIYHKNERAKPNLMRRVPARGSTAPLAPLLEAERIFKISDKPIKLLFIVSDGEWSSSNNCNEVIKRLNNSNVITSMVYMSSPLSLKMFNERLHNNDETIRQYAKNELNGWKHNAQVFQLVSTPNDVLDVAVKIIKSKVGK